MNKRGLILDCCLSLVVLRLPLLLLLLATMFLEEFDFFPGIIVFHSICYYWGEIYQLGANSLFLRVFPVTVDDLELM